MERDWHGESLKPAGSQVSYGRSTGVMTLSLDEITGAGEAVPKQEYERREGEERGGL
jgi:hypothetical protein